MAKSITWQSVYQLVDERLRDLKIDIKDVDSKVDKVDGKVETVGDRVANIEGRLLMIPILVSTGVSVFFFIIGNVIGK